MISRKYIMEHGTARSLKMEILVVGRIQFIGKSVKGLEHIAAVIADHFTRDEIIAMTSLKREFGTSS